MKKAHRQMNKKKCLITFENRREMVYHLINAALAGGLVFLGSLTNGNVTLKGLIASLIAALIVIIAKFKEYWDGEKKEYSSKLFAFIRM